MSFHNEHSDLIDELRGYPNYGDQSKVRPSIRAIEASLDPLLEVGYNWSNDFWKESLKISKCHEAFTNIANSENTKGNSITRKKITDVMSQLTIHWRMNLIDTNVDPKSDAVFGICFYCIRILVELMGIGVSNSVIGRLGLRTIFECYITLKYLLSNDNKELWIKWRQYGIGQAKLNSLKFHAISDSPAYISIESVNAIANEDMWAEYQSIELGSWSGLDLRKISDSLGLKDLYDLYYSWPSGYSHGTWHAIRESCFRTCGNPLHRLHRYPEMNVLSDVLFDAAFIVDLILDEINLLYPHFVPRLNRDKI